MKTANLIENNPRQIGFMHAGNMAAVELCGVNEGMKMKLILNQKCGLVGQSVGQWVSGSAGQWFSRVSRVSSRRR